MTHRSELPFIRRLSAQLAHNDGRVPVILTFRLKVITTQLHVISLIDERNAGLFDFGELRTAPRRNSEVARVHCPGQLGEIQTDGMLALTHGIVHHIS